MLRHRLNHWFNFHVHLSVQRQSHRSHEELIRSGIFNAFIKYFKITKNKANNIHVPFCRVLATYTDKADPIHHLYPHSYITLPFVWVFVLFFCFVVFFFCYHLYLVHIFNLFFIIIFFNIYLIHMFTIGTHQTTYMQINGSCSSPLSR